MRVQVLLFEGCPHGPSTLQLVREVVRERGLETTVEEKWVRDMAEARRLAFLGSPSVQVNGLDIERSRRGDSAYGMSCRLYGSSGTPSKGMIEAALEEAS